MVSNGGCDHNCSNTEGSYECSCRDGYTLEPDHHTCEDTNECLNFPCNHSCVNLRGSFECECYDGYSLDRDGVTCHGMIVVKNEIITAILHLLTYRY